MSQNEDVLTQSYKYAWTLDSDVSLDDFLTKYKPSMVQNDGTKPWIWVKGAAPPKDAEDKDVATAIKEAIDCLNDATERVQKIKNDASIPIRSNKKTGAKSKKELCERIQTEAVEKLKTISIQYKYTHGKWLTFVPPDKVDKIWSSLATSLVSGPLASTSAHLAKVSTCPEDGKPDALHLICVYIPDVYDKDDVTNVMKVLLRNHGLNLSGVKSDLYTLIGLYSQHPSGIPSTVWKNATLLSASEIKELKDAYFADPPAAAQKPPQATSGPSTTATAQKPPATSGKQKPKLKKKAAEDDPFASDADEDQAEEDDRKRALQSKKTQKRPKDSDDEDGDNVRPKRKQGKKVS